ncbi:hypothetical protein EHS25_002787 [Saitozyma podzolica]|uniref:Zn(2)-C6 fungal-type domain-containing protein n=1 Tax=Saitozyma podzolica TaxID=1890683 RepID=A0A427YD83_9TREE|nr:hypothetical protein EHS25_002787 [Saitozyma podzolica]
MSDRDTTGEPSSGGERPSKRPKARRACDQCRIKKLRCKYDEDSPTTPCRTCQQHGTACESVKPARIDKRRLQTLVKRAETDVDRRWIAEQVARRGLYDSVSGRPRKQRPSAVGDPALLLREIDTKSEMVKPASPVSPIQSGAVSVSPITTSNPVPTAPGPSTSVGSAPLPSHFWDRYTQLGASHRVPALPTMISSRETRVQGPTASVTLLAEIEDEGAVAEHDRRFLLHRVGDSVFGGDPAEPMIDESITERQIQQDAMENLIMFFVSSVAPFNPVIAPNRVAEAINSSPLVLFSILAVSALHRSVPTSVYLSTRRRLHDHVLDTVERGSTFERYLALLISTMSHELHGNTNMEGGSLCWLRLGLAIRQAQDLGLHRLNAPQFSHEGHVDKARAWIGTIVADRWFSAAFGQPLTIDLWDCENPLAHASGPEMMDDLHIFQAEMCHISCILGKISQTVYRPRALERCTDDTLHSLVAEFDQRISRVPESLTFHGPSTSTQGGLLNLFIGAAEILLFRPFVKLNRKLPPHLTFRPSAARWYTTVQRCQASISWMSVNGDVLLDCWLPGKFALTYSALAQYYHYMIDGDTDSLRSLEVARETMDRWALGREGNQPIPSRAKIADIVNVLYHAAVRSKHGIGRRGSANGPPAEASDAPKGPAPAMDQSTGVFYVDTTFNQPTSLAGDNAPPEAAVNFTLDNVLPPSSEAWLDPAFSANVADSTDHTLDDWLREIFRDYGMPVDGDATAWSGAGDLGFSMDHLYGGQ